MKHTNTIAVTGGQGFIGQHLVHELSAHCVRIFDKHAQSLNDPKSLKTFLSGATVIVHLAGVNRASDSQMFTVNTLGTAGLVEGMKLYCPNARLVYASSSQVYLHDSAYGLSKQFAEDIIKWYTKITGIQAIVLRFANVYGPGCKPFYNSVIATFVHKALHNEPIIIHGDGCQKRDYVFVADAVQALIKAIQAPDIPTFSAVDICTGTLVPLTTIVDILKRHVLKPINVQTEPKNGDWTERKAIMPTQARELLGWIPATTLEDGIQLIVKGCA